ncbi:hypothetical protein [Duganella aceris]|uniref:Primosomal replication protein PriB/PriC domain protein n=1 Tax=Duganella aceris TaxID=2703883 RepID=A0ABX0FPG0_9BURK|nr:hypothetical protein [Duganella aceris]NGZ86420.1 hypothetical protein [Duganella aceris]
MTPAEMLAKYMTAEAAILEGKEVRFGDRALRMEDLSEVRAGRIEWERRVAAGASQVAGRPTFGGLGYSLADFRGEQ